MNIQTKQKIKSEIKRFLYESFRPHSKSEYAEIFTRGNGSDGHGSYPWLYARVWFLCIAMFTIAVVGKSVSGLNTASLYFLGASFGNLGFIILLYELYPSRDFSLISLLAAVFAGGVISIGFAQIYYSIATFSKVPFGYQAWVALAEETSKAAATVILLLILKKRNPFFCFLVGAAVGTGFSALEDMSYMYSGYSVYNIVLQGVVRSFGAPFSHAAWAGLFGWALSFEKPWKNIKTYAVMLFNMAMHFLVNFPLMNMFAEWKGYPFSIVSGILSICFEIYVLVRLKRRFEPTSEVVGEGADGTERVKHLQICANVVASVAIFLSVAFLLTATYVYRGRYYSSSIYFDSWEECREYVQNGLEFSVDTHRDFIVYDDLNENFSYTVEEGELRIAVQREQVGEYFYRYEYGYIFSGSVEEIIEDSAAAEAPEVSGDELVKPQEPEEIFVLRNIYVEIEDSLYRLFIITDSELTVTDENGEEQSVTYGCFYINEEVYYVSASGGTFRVTYDDEHYIGLTSGIVLASLGVASVIAGAAAYITLKIKIRRNKDGVQLHIL